MYLEKRIKEWRQWKAGDNVFLEAPTGTGKTSFVLNCLVPDALKEGQKVLFLSNRYLLKEQVKNKVARSQGIPDRVEWLEKVEEFEGITVMSYQKLQKLVKAGYLHKYCIPTLYKYIVLDEIHYLLEDAVFNPEIIFLQEFIRSVHSVNVFMSATLEETRKYLLNSGMLWKRVSGSEYQFGKYLTVETQVAPMLSVVGWYSYNWYYRFPYQHHRMEVHYFNDFSQIAEEINKSSEKWLIFVSNKNSVENWKGKIRKPKDMISADDRKPEIVDQIIKNERFETQVLITTKLLDNGVNFCDRELRHIVIDTISRVEFLQMLGRKRMEEDEMIHIYIPKKTLKYFSGYYNLSAARTMEMIDGTMSTTDLLAACMQDPSVYEVVKRYCIVKENGLVLNPAGVYKARLQAQFLEKMQKLMQKDEWAFVKEQLRWMQMEDTFSEEKMLPDYEQEKIYDEISCFLQESEGIWMGKREQDNFRKKLGNLFDQVGLWEKHGERIPGKNVIERILATKFPSLKLVVKKASRKGEETLWRMEMKNDVLGG